MRSPEDISNELKRRTFLTSLDRIGGDVLMFYDFVTL